mmetsp:Transcript_60847/g.145015  ORF Transcript_60847/g.145015 Transcript_60847/m.145015 type:complete len:794 (+) Transcript_60847:201-2582(+)|eukprot:CAMPEP_0178416036 /NCGR_PEP_ID=MMETSP0689_2-20121128/23855_1 /TAXON_ID=160604 /ORGANISM="Amphidinium massartii, Strain CS-259" /LENGTH=793 /DNA_ID=CAMNT_0020037365 /DNA_START=126 /DNA_END=2507 /DNA_ORIENTATION=-
MAGKVAALTNQLSPRHGSPASKGVSPRTEGISPALAHLLQNHMDHLHTTLEAHFASTNLLLCGIWEILHKDELKSCIGSRVSTEFSMACNPSGKSMSPCKHAARNTGAAAATDLYMRAGKYADALAHNGSIYAVQAPPPSTHEKKRVADNMPGGGLGDMPLELDNPNGKHQSKDGVFSVDTVAVRGMIDAATDAMKAMEAASGPARDNETIRRLKSERGLASHSVSVRAAGADRGSGRRGSVDSFFDSLKTSRDDWRKVTCEQVVEGCAFRVLCSFIILVDAVLLGVQTDHVVRHGEATETAVVLDHVHETFIAWYIVELLLRLIAARSCKLFLMGKEWRWNVFDLCMSMASLADIFLANSGLRELAVGRLLRTLRLIRTLRVFRILRFLTFLREFHKLVLCLASSLQTLLCVFSLMTFFVYGMSILLTKTAGTYLKDNVGIIDARIQDDIERSFGSVGYSMLSMYMAITGGRNWGELFHLLELVSVGVAYMYIAFLVISIYGLTNVVTAVFVESAMQATQNYRDLLVQEMFIRDQATVKHMKEIFQSIDTDGSGTISAHEMDLFMKDETLALQEYFEALGISANDTETLFKLLDRDSSGEVDIDEFCDGCMRLGGTAKSFDINCMWHEQRRTNREMLRFVQLATKGLHNLKEAQAEEAEELARVAENAQKLLEGPRLGPLRVASRREVKEVRSMPNLSGARSPPGGGSLASLAYPRPPPIVSLFQDFLRNQTPASAPGRPESTSIDQRASEPASPAPLAIVEAEHEAPWTHESAAPLPMIATLQDSAERAYL